MNRRRFLGRTAVAAAGAALLPVRELLPTPKPAAYRQMTIDRLQLASASLPLLLDYTTFSKLHGSTHEKWSAAQTEFLAGIYRRHATRPPSEWEYPDAL